MKIKHPFKAPDTYFEKLEGDIMDNTPESLLTKIGKKNIYTVSDQFFETQYLEILNKKASIQAPTYNHKRSLAWVTTAVASLALILFSYSYIGSDKINDILSKEGEIIQSDISDLPVSSPPVDMTTNKDSLAKATK